MQLLSRAELPDDIDALKGMIISQSFELEKLRAQIGKLRRHQFGVKSETLEQLEMLLDDMVSVRGRPPMDNPRLDRRHRPSFRWERKEDANRA